MSLKRFLILSFLSIFALSMFSCNETEEETNEKFEWNYVKRKMQIQGTDTSWVIESTEKYIVDEYSVLRDSNMMRIMGHTTSNDSIVIDILNSNPGKTITVGEYNISGENRYNIQFFKGTFPFISVNGYAYIQYINSRVDIEFYSPLSNGYTLENGVAENLDVYLVPELPSED